jgi:hypothetical protein
MRLIYILTIMSFVSYGQTKTRVLETKKYGGTFSYEKGKVNGSGKILIYPETDTTVLFYIDVNRGAPSYNMGSLYGRLKIINGQGNYESKDKGSRWTLQFSKNRITIGTVAESYDCGFGNGVTADGIFEQTSKIIPDYFVNGEGTKYYFTTTTPEKYNE